MKKAPKISSETFCGVLYTYEEKCRVVSSFGDEVLICIYNMRNHLEIRKIILYILHVSHLCLVASIHIFLDMTIQKFNKTKTVISYQCANHSCCVAIPDNIRYRFQVSATIY